MSAEGDKDIATAGDEAIRFFESFIDRTKENLVLAMKLLDKLDLNTHFVRYALTFAIKRQIKKCTKEADERWGERIVAEVLNYVDFTDFRKPSDLQDMFLVAEGKLKEV